jgi:DNA polymerase III epsilon subunit family exonuclease
MFIALDIETTGFDPIKDEPIEIAAIKFDEEKIYETLHFMVNPKKEIPEVVVHITGIRQSDVDNAPVLSEIEKDVLAFVGDLPIVGHNIGFDIGFLRAKGWTMNNPLYDTLTLSQILLPKFPSYSLETVAGSFQLTKHQTHRADDDASINAELFQILLKKIPANIDPRIKSMLERSNWPFKEFFLHGTEGEKTKNPEIAAAEKIPTWTAEQEHITDIIYSGMKNKECVLLEAGVGTGKYPALCEAIKKCQQESFFAKEKTLLVVDSQEIENLLVENLEDTFILETKDRYVSLDRYWKFVEKKEHENYEISFALKLFFWLQETKTGAMDELTLQREDFQCWEEVSHNEWLCEDEKSFAANAEKQAKNTKLLITGHVAFAEFLTDKDSDALKGTDHIIVLEAERIEENIQSALTKNYSLKSTERRIPRNHSDLEKSFAMFFGLLGIFYEKYNQEGDNIIVQPSHMKTIEWNRIQDAFEKIWKRLDEDKSLTLKKIQKEWKHVAEILIEEKTGSYLVLSQSIEGDMYIKFLPFETMHHIWKQPACKKAKSLILISETLRVKRSFDYIKNRLRIDRPIREEVVDSPADIFRKVTITIPQNFPDASQIGHFEKVCALLKQYTIETPGKTIALFGTKKAVHATYYDLHEPMREQAINVIAQDFSGGRGKMMEKYRKNPDSSLLIGTMNFLEKSQLSILPAENLVINKLPFDPPNDPTVILETNALTDGFEEYSVPQAVLKFLGLINAFLKSEGATKNITILDNRILKKGYGKSFIESLPEGVKIVQE